MNMCGGFSNQAFLKARNPLVLCVRRYPPRHSPAFVKKLNKPDFNKPLIHYLQIPVDNIVGVQKLKSQQNFNGQDLAFLFSDPLHFLYVEEKLTPGAVFSHKEQFLFLGIITFIRVLL